MSESFILFFLLLQLVILGYDSARPRRSSTVTCTISVLRNSNPPVWQRLPHNATIRENQPYISSIYNVTATDNDAGVCLFLIDLIHFHCCLINILDIDFQIIFSKECLT